MWPDLIQKAKRGGINLIQTYVFWNLHEPVEGKVMNPNVFLVKRTIREKRWKRQPFYWKLCDIAVWIWRKIWPGQVHQDNPRAWPVCYPQNRTLHWGWMELWVSLAMTHLMPSSLHERGCISFVFSKEKRKGFVFVKICCTYLSLQSTICFCCTYFAWILLHSQFPVG